MKKVQEKTVASSAVILYNEEKKPAQPEVAQKRLPRKSRLIDKDGGLWYSGDTRGEEAMSFGEQLQFLRRGSGLTQEQFAEQLHVSRQAVSKWESGGSLR